MLETRYSCLHLNQDLITCWPHYIVVQVRKQKTQSIEYVIVPVLISIRHVLHTVDGRKGRAADKVDRVTQFTCATIEEIFIKAYIIRTISAEM